MPTSSCLATYLVVPQASGVVTSSFPNLYLPEQVRQFYVHLAACILNMVISYSSLIPPGPGRDFLQLYA